MESMLYANIFKKLTIYDLQGLCKNVTEIKEADDQNVSTGLLTASKNFCYGCTNSNLELCYEFLSHSSCYFFGSNGCSLK